MASVRHLEFDTSIDGFILDDDPILLTFLEFRESFGNDDRATIAIHSDRIFSFSFLTKLRALHEDLEENALHIAKIDSLINARWTEGTADALVVDDLFEEWPQDEAELAAIQDRALANPLYEDVLLSHNGRYTAITLQLDTYSTNDSAASSGFEDGFDASGDDSEDQPLLSGEEILAAIGTLREIMARHEGPDFPLYLAGGPVIEERLSLTMGTDLVRFLGLSMLAATVILFVLFRRLSGALLPLGIVLLSLVGTLGLSASFGIPVSLLSQILPALLLAVGVGDSVHILTIFYQNLERGDPKEGAIASALGHSGLAVLMTSVTTAAALLSFRSAVLAPVKDLGLIAPVGILLALIYTVVFLPAMLALLPIAARSRAQERVGVLDRFLAACARAATERPWTVVGLSLAILIASLLAATQARFSHNPLSWFPADGPLRQSMEVMNEEMRGGITLEVLFETDRENGLHEPALLAKMEALQRDNESLRTQDIFIGKSISLVDVIKEINQALNENRPDFRRVPDDRLLIAQELLLFEMSGSDDLDDYTDSLFTTGRMTLRAPYEDAIQYAPFIREIEQHYAERIGDDAKVEVTGLMPLLMRTFEAMILSMSRSYVLALIIIGPLMMVFLASIRLGAISMFPNLLPIVMTLGIMGLADFPLDMFTMLIGSIALGLAVDDTIHFMHGFNRYYARSGDSAEAVRSTLATSGRALLVTTLVLCCAFLVFTRGELSTLFNFGLLTSTTLALAFLADVLLAPALMVLIKGSSHSAAGTDPV
jgi:predicted RND superfamily exporter protein